MASFYWRSQFGGNWSDLSNWRTTATGTTIPTSQPGINDGIFFDNNSFYDTDDKTLFTTITLTASATCSRIYNTATMPFRIQSDIATKPHQGRTLTCQATSIALTQTSVNSLFGVGNCYFDGNNVNLQFTNTATATDELIWPREITEEEYLDKYISLSQLTYFTSTSTTVKTTKFTFDYNVFLPSTRIYTTVSAAASLITLFSTNGSTLTCGGLSYNTTATTANVGNTLIFRATNKYDIQYTVSPYVFLFPLAYVSVFPGKVIVDNYGTSETEMSITTSSRPSTAALYRYNNVEVNFYSNTRSIVKLGGLTATTSNYHFTANNLTINGMGPNNIVLVGEPNTYTNRIYIGNTLFIENISLYNNASNIGNRGYISVPSAEAATLRYIEFQRISFNYIVDAINSRDVPLSGQPTSTNINFINQAGQEETVEVTALFEQIVTYINKEASVKSKATFGPINVDIDTIRESILAVEAEFGEIVVAVEAIGFNGSTATEVDVTAVFGEIITAATRTTSTVTSRTVTSTFGEITTSTNYAVVIPIKTQFGEINTSTEITTKAIRTYETTSTFGEINTFARIFILYKLPSQIILEIKEPVGVLTFDPSHLHFSEEEGRNHLWPTQQTV